MKTLFADSGVKPVAKVKPVCPVFGICGGCAYQDLPYTEELAFKERKLLEAFRRGLNTEGTVFEPIVASPLEYGYRGRLDLTLRRLKDGRFVMGFQPPESHRVVEIEGCPIALAPLSAAIPRIKEEGMARLPVNYRGANIVIKAGPDGRVFWGGIGRRSLEMHPRDYLWVEISGKKIFYSLDTFFQANVAILSAVIEKINTWIDWQEDTLFFDLYAGVGLFGILVADRARHVIMIEESKNSVRLMRHNVAYHDLHHAEVIEGKVETEFLPLLDSVRFAHKVAMIDPPRKGLSRRAAEVLLAATSLNSLLYLSCNPLTLLRDLRVFESEGWKICRVAPFDFFPKTAHLETLVLLEPPGTRNRL